VTVAVLAPIVALFAMPGGHHAREGLSTPRLPRGTVAPTAPKIVMPSPSGAPTTKARTSTSTSNPVQTTRAAASPYRHVRWSFDNGRSGWIGGDNATTMATNSPVLSGAGALAVHNSSAQTRTITASSASSMSSLTPARSGMRIFGAVAMRSGAANRNVHVTVTFLDATGQRLASATGQSSSDSASAWAQTYDAVGIAPPHTAYTALTLTITKAGPGETHYADNATLDEYRGSSRDIVGPLRTSGNRILDAHGRTVILRGFTRVGLEGADAEPPTEDDIAHAKAWGANIIRLPLGEQFWLSSSCHRRVGYAAQIDSAVRMVTDLGMVALLDLHWNSLRSCGSYGQQPMADAPGALTFWQQIATRYKDNPLVAFDLYNEPHNISDAVWLSGGSVTWKGVKFTAAGMQQMYNAVRNTGARNLVIASGNDWGNRWPSTGPLTGFNVVYGIHAYTCQVSPPPNCHNRSPYDPGQFFQYWGAASQQVPVAVTEFGWPDPNNGRYISAVINYAAARGWGWTAFTWGNASWGPFSLLATAGPGSDYEPRPTGEAVLAGFSGN
jgi:endoglucanase